MARLVAELAKKDFKEIAACIGDLGEEIDLGEFPDMYVAVELDDDLLEAMRQASARARSDSGHEIPGTETENA